MAVAIAQTATGSGNSGAGSTVTITSASLGAAAEGRIVAVVIQAYSTPSSVTLNTGSGAVAMSATTTSHVFDSPNGLDEYARIFYLADNSGSTGTFIITVSPGIFADVAATVYRVTGASATLYNSGINSSTDATTTPLTTGSLLIPTNAGWLGGAVFVSGDSTWANATEDRDTMVDGAIQVSNAIRVTSGTVTITDTNTVGEPVAGALVWALFSESSGQTAQSGSAGQGNLSVSITSVQQASARFSGVGSLRAAGTGLGDQFGSARFAGAGNLSINTIYRSSARATYGGSGSVSVNTTYKLAARIRFGGVGALSVDTTHIQAPVPIDLTLHVGEWPLALPQCPVLNGFSEQRQRNAIEFQPEVGFTKLHRRATTSVVQTSVTFRMTDSEVDIFNEWYVDYQDDGTLEFTWDHPITKVNYSWMFDAQDAPHIERMTPDTFRVSFNLLRLD